VNPRIANELASVMGITPYQPPAQFDPVVTTQPEFQADSDEQAVQDWLVEHGSAWRIAHIDDRFGYMLVYENANPTHMEIWGF